jgi:acyl dehydratase
MPVDQSLVGAEFPPTLPREVTAEHVRAFAAATGGDWEPGRPVPATYPITLAFEAMNAFLGQVGIDLSRIVHGEQRFSYARPVLPGDVLSAALTVSSLRQIGGNDIIGTTSTVRDADGAEVCSATATLVHRGGEER